MFAWFKSEGRSDSLSGRLARSQDEGYARGAQEARLCRLATGRQIERKQALDWLNTVIEDGRIDLQAQHASEREVEAWDTSCRIMFWVTLGPMK
jgi:hypothetical protein